MVVTGENRGWRKTTEGRRLLQWAGRGETERGKVSVQREQKLFE
jgi:hypothetical protein